MKENHHYFRIFGSRVLFFMLAPWLIICIFLFPYITTVSTPEDKTAAYLMAVVFSACCLSGLLVGIDSKRFGKAILVITVSVPAAYLWYFIDTFFLEGMELTPSQRKSDATPWNAILGFCAFGIPSILATIGILKGKKWNTAEEQHGEYAFCTHFFISCSTEREFDETDAKIVEGICKELNEFLVREEFGEIPVVEYNEDQIEIYINSSDESRLEGYISQSIKPHSRLKYELRKDPTSR
ncbi:hypothetical protein [Cerasicoccus fimbriatus]|uniref:hypothetical protein n=1 Tax=Cerasicoccus fimbriatus TaxID=3014554 RepID=UPI0022B35514|nr:hypothetical protein [Cerasicoccus sp. TK19100]